MPELAYIPVRLKLKLDFERDYNNVFPAIRQVGTRLRHFAAGRFRCKVVRGSTMQAIEWSSSPLT